MLSGLLCYESLTQRRTHSRHIHHHYLGNYRHVHCVHPDPILPCLPLDQRHRGRGEDHGRPPFADNSGSRQRAQFVPDLRIGKCHLIHRLQHNLRPCSLYDWVHRLAYGRLLALVHAQNYELRKPPSQNPSSKH